jgi:hypothetical protein
VAEKRRRRRRRRRRKERHYIYYRTGKHKHSLLHGQTEQRSIQKEGGRKGTP